ncbi:MAG: exodeoxyribonuclease VII small subunit [Phycisphaerales bacterium]
MAKKTVKSKPEPRYEDVIEQLESLVEHIESGEIGLEESIQGYENGLKLVQKARSILDQAQQRIIELDADAKPTDSD